MTEEAPALIQASPDAESRVWAALGNGSGLLLGIGIAIPTFGWADSRTQRPFAAFQSLQALGYQTVGYTVWVLLYLALSVLFSIASIPLASALGSGSDRALFIWMGAFFAAAFGMWGLYLILPLIAAISTALGRNFHYPLLGTRLEKLLGYDSGAGSGATLDEARADRWVAAMGHFAVILPLWGLSSPLVALGTQRDRSPFLRFQSLQAIALQLTVLLLYAGIMSFYLLGFVGFVLSMFAGGGSEPSIPGLIIFLAMMCFVLAFALLVPIFHLLGQWAGVRILQGHDYYYPLLGGLVARWAGYGPRAQAEGEA